MDKEVSFLQAKSLTKFYTQGFAALRDVSISISKGERLGIVGTTGSGKSTLLKLIGGRLQVDSGTITFDNEKVKGTEERLIPGHERIAYLSQHFELPKFITVLDHLSDEYLIAPDEAEQIYKACQITHLLSNDTSALSGGEKQRVALAKLLLTKPELILLDEPFSNLDFIHKRQIKRVLTNVEIELGTTVLLVAHDPRDVLSWADNIIVLRKGEITQQGSPEDIYHNPNDEYVAGLFGDYNLLDPKKWHVSSKHRIINNKVLIRPEDITMSSVDGVKAQIVDLRFAGSKYEVIARVEHTEVLFYSTIEGLVLGSTVQLGIKES